MLTARSHCKNFPLLALLRPEARPGLHLISVSVNRRWVAQVTPGQAVLYCTSVLCCTVLLYCTIWYCTVRACIWSLLCICVSEMSGSSYPGHQAGCSHQILMQWSASSASKRSIRRFIITEKAPTRAFSWLKAATTAFTFKTLLTPYCRW